MPTPVDSKIALSLLTADAGRYIRALLAGLTGSPEQIMLQLLDLVPSLVDYFTPASSALAADLFDDLRESADTRRRFQAEPVIDDRTVKIRRAVVWAVEGLAQDDTLLTSNRLAEIMQKEVARPYRDTILTNTHRDPDAVGWSRVAGDGCGFCRMLAARGAVYKSTTAGFAAHSHCDCTARPVFRGEPGEEASVLQYVASRRSKSANQQAQLREYLATFYPDE